MRSKQWKANPPVGFATQASRRFTAAPKILAKKHRHFNNIKLQMRMLAIGVSFAPALAECQGQ
ncbi:hypothetical protein [Ketobacter sp.]|uniref:hypothetical protein n=1 Tax=Ketobacter sp. TaxID=2083498 RepID=UPI0025C50C53|nr:hypothetical protein [Ketobacter sp.]